MMIENNEDWSNVCQFDDWMEVCVEEQDEYRVEGEEYEWSGIMMRSTFNVKARSEGGAISKMKGELLRLLEGKESIFMVWRRGDE